MDLIWWIIKLLEVCELVKFG